MVWPIPTSTNLKTFADTFFNGQHWHENLLDEGFNYGGPIEHWWYWGN